MTDTTATLTPGRSLDLPLRRPRRFLRSPKGYLLLALVPLLLVAAPSTGLGDAATVVTAAVLGATLLELACVRLRSGAWEVPSSALLSGLIVAMVLSAQQPWYVAAAAGVLATASKHLLRLGRGQLFNPAAVGLLAVYVLFGSGQSWWGAWPDLPGVANLVVLAAGCVVAGRANKLPAVLAFCGVYVGLFTAAAAAGHAAAVADIFRPPFLNMALYCACFMVTDPPTSPVPFPAQIVYGAAVALVSFATYLATHGLYYLLTGLLVANVGYAFWQRVRARTRQPASTVTGVFARPARGTSRSRPVGIAPAAAGVAGVLLLAAGLAIVQRTSSGTAAVARRTTAPAQRPNASTAGAQPAGAAPAQPAARPQPPAGGTVALTFADHFAGSVTQGQSPDGSTLDFDLTGSGERAVRLTIHLVLSATRGGRNRAIENQATLFDSTGAPLCQGRVTQLDNQGFAVECDSIGGAARTVELEGTITGGKATHIEGDLQAAPLAG